MSKSNRWSGNRDAAGQMDVTRKQFDWSETRPSMAVPEVISAITGREQTDFAPLYEAIDPEALDALVQSDSSVSVSFEHAGHSITVRSDGEVVVHTATASIGR